MHNNDVNRTIDISVGQYTAFHPGGWMVPGLSAELQSIVIINFLL